MLILLYGYIGCSIHFIYVYIDEPKSFYRINLLNCIGMKPNICKYLINVCINIEQTWTNQHINIFSYPDLSLYLLLLFFFLVLLPQQVCRFEWHQSLSKQMVWMWCFRLHFFFMCANLSCQIELDYILCIYSMCNKQEFMTYGHQNNLHFSNIIDVRVCVCVSAFIICECVVTEYQCYN